MPPTSNAGGRPASKFNTDHFRKLDNVANNSNRHFWECKYCAEDGTATRIEGRDNRLLKHICDPKNCPKAPAEARQEARMELMRKGCAVIDVPLFSASVPSTPAVSENGSVDPEGRRGTNSEPPSGVGLVIATKKRKAEGTLDKYVDRGLTEQQENEAHVKLFRWLVHKNVSFVAVESPLFLEFTNVIRPSYVPPTRYILTHRIMDAEAARAQTEDVKRLQEMTAITLLIDGWEDMLRRSLYGTVAAAMAEDPTVLALSDLTGYRGSADKLLEVATAAVSNMELPPRNIIAATTDNPMTMRSFRNKLKAEYPWIITLPCFLHSLNTIIGKILTFAPMKKVLTRNARIVTFFNGSHYWGGQLDQLAKSQGISRSLKTHSETRWYTVVLQALSVQSYQQALRQLSFRPDAKRRTGNMSPVASDVITIIEDPAYWRQVDQLIRTIKPLVDAIGNLESRDVNLADCMLELIRCARHMYRIELTDDDDIEFNTHAKLTFNREFHKMNTDIHALALFLHPACRKLAISQAAKGRSFQSMCTTALDIVKGWGWSLEDAGKVVDDMQHYYQRQPPYTGAQADAMAWWKSLPIDADDHPLKVLAITIFSIVPHAADVERLFSDLGGIQGPKRCQLTVPTFETLGKLRANYTRHLHQRAKSLGLPIRRRHAHMHTRDTPGSNIELSEDLERTFAWQPPLSVATEGENELQGPESITPENIDKAFEELEQRTGRMDPELEQINDNDDIQPHDVYPFEELARIDDGAALIFEDQVNIHNRQGGGGGGGGGNWDAAAILASKGISNT